MRNQSKPIPNLGQLHIIRGIAALMVAIGHAKIVFWVGGKEYLEKFPRSSWSVKQYFQFATDMASSASEEFVTMFFILSGFFIAFTFHRNQWKWKDFYVNRMLRIYPPFLFAVVASILVMFVVAKVNPAIVNYEVHKPMAKSLANAYNKFEGLSILKILFFQPHKNQWVGSNLSLWSLSAEWFFYLLAPFLVFRKKLAFFLSIPLYLIGWYLDFEHFVDTDTVGEFVFEHCFYFFTGMLVFDIVQHKNWKPYIPNQWVSYGIILFFAAVMIALGALSLYPYGDLTSVIVTIICIFVLLKYPIRNKTIQQIGTFLGDISYSLYVIHIPVYFLVYLTITEITSQYNFYDRIYWLAVPIAILAGYITYKLVEEPSLRAIRRFKTKNGYTIFDREKK